MSELPNPNTDAPVRFRTLDDIRIACRTLPPGSDACARAVAERQRNLTKPPGSLGRLETLAAWLGRWQHRPMPRMDRVDALVFAGNHGVTAQGVSPYPSEVTVQMVANFEQGGAAINQICAVTETKLRVVPLDLDRPTRDFTAAPAMDEGDFLTAVNVGAASVAPDTDVLCLGEMGIGNTTVAAAICAALFGGGGAAWAGRGTGVDDAGLARKASAIDLGLDRHRAALHDPLAVASHLGGRELAAILGATLTARLRGVPVLLDGFVSTAAAAPLFALARDGLDHAEVAHVSAESGHRRLVERFGKRPLLDLDMRLGEASGAVLAVSILRAAVACHAGMASFAQAGVSNRD